MKRSRWDETPVSVHAMALAAAAAMTPHVSREGFAPGVGGGGGGVGGGVASRDSFTDAELDALLPDEGYRVLEAPASYVPVRTPARKLLATPTPGGGGGFTMEATPARADYGVPATPGEARALGAGALGRGDLPFIAPEDEAFFGALLGAAGAKPDEELTADEAIARRVALLILRVKSGAPHSRKMALRELGERARELGAGPLFSVLLPLLMSPTLEAAERHALVKVINRVLLALDELVRPYAHKILVVVEPMLIDEDSYARIEGRELIANLAKAAGLATMIAVMRPDIDSPDEFVRNTTARAFAVVATALGLGALLPFLRAVTGSKKSWAARHTGAKVVQQVAILAGCGVLPHLAGLVTAVGPCLNDDTPKVRVMAALALAALAEASAPYGIEAFDGVLRPLWKGLEKARGKACVPRAVRACAPRPRRPSPLPAPPALPPPPVSPHT
jgi:splicing factor 3B subunit 1